MENTGNLQKELFAYVKENTFKEIKSLTSDTMLFVEGIFDSMGFVLLLDFLEENYQIVTDDEDLIEENFESIDAITAFVLRKNSTVVQ
ncbi:MAG: acyl carrier protein [Bacteroidales bacterium]|nr:acyl carrier protein [Bacteroidales bacterium]